MLRFTETQGLPGDLCEMRYLWWLSCSFSSPPSNVNYTWANPTCPLASISPSCRTSTSPFGDVAVQAAWALPLHELLISGCVTLCPVPPVPTLCTCHQTFFSLRQNLPLHELLISGCVTLCPVPPVPTLCTCHQTFFFSKTKFVILFYFFIIIFLAYYLPANF